MIYFLKVGVSRCCRKYIVLKSPCLGVTLIRRVRHVKPLGLSQSSIVKELVDLERFELSTPRLSSECSNQLSYRSLAGGAAYTPLGNLCQT